MKSLVVNSHFTDINHIKLDLVEKPTPNINKNQCLIKIAASGINASDALATMGYFQHAVLPRIPGRDFAGVVVDGPKELIGQQVWGTGGAAGISSDGVQAEFIKLDIDQIAEIPNNLDLITASAQTLPYVTAYYSLVTRANIQAGETVLITGALGQVGQAAMAICRWKKCHAIALVRSNDDIQQAKKLGWTALDSQQTNLQDEILAINQGRPIDVILNSLGNSYWQTLINSLGAFGRIVTIAARENLREAMINLFEMYRANQTIIGVNTVAFNFSENAKLLNQIKLGFEANQLVPIAVDAAKIYSPATAAKAYQDVLKGSAGKRVVISFN